MSPRTSITLAVALLVLASPAGVVGAASQTAGTTAAVDADVSSVDTANETSDETNETDEDGAPVGPVDPALLDAVEYGNTTPLPAARVAPDGLAGDVRVENGTENVSAVAATDENETFVLTLSTSDGPSNDSETANATGASNVSVYLNASVVAPDPAGLVASVDGDATRFGLVGADNASWLLVVVPDLDEDTRLAFSVPGEDEADEEEEAAEEDDEEGGDETAPDDSGLGLASYENTTELGGEDTSPAELAGDVRVENGTENASVAVVANSSTNLTLDVAAEANQTNVTFLVATDVLQPDPANVSATIDGEALRFEVVTAGNASWLGFEVDHFSTRRVAFAAEEETDGADEGSDGAEPSPGPVAGLPEGVEPFPETTALSGPDDVDPPSLSGKIRVESVHAANTTATATNNTQGNTTLEIDVAGHAENVTFYMQTTAIAASQNMSNVTLTVDGDRIEFGTADERGSPWVGFEVDHFSTRTVSFRTVDAGPDTGNQTGNDTTVGPPENDTTVDPPENDTTVGPPENDTAGPPENVTAGPVEGMPTGVAAFLETSPLDPGSVDPASLSGKIRVEREHEANTTVTMTENSTNRTSMEINVTGHAENVTFFVQTDAVAASQNVSNVTAMVDGDPIHYGLTNESNQSWIGFEVDHFSTRTVTFQSADAGAGPLFETPLPGLGSDAAPTDPDDDGLYEDVDGDGQVVFQDAVDLGLVAAFGSDSGDLTAEQEAALDFDGDGAFDFQDAIELGVQIALG
jgi:hypothetical protein